MEKKLVETKKESNSEAKILLNELKVQHAVQEKLIEQQKEIIEELKLHQKEAHQASLSLPSTSLVSIQKLHNQN